MNKHEIPRSFVIFSPRNFVKYGLWLLFLNQQKNCRKKNLEQSLKIWINELVHKKWLNKLMMKWMNNWINQCTNEYLNKLMDRWINGLIQGGIGDWMKK